MEVKFRYILFDWDGCLANTLPVWVEAMKSGLAHFGIHTTDENVKKGFQGWDVFAKLGVPDMEIFKEQVYKYISANVDNVELNEGVAETLKMVKEAGIRSAIVTTSEKDKILPVLERYNLSDHFEGIIDRNDVEKFKPDAEAVYKAMGILNADPDFSVIIGDSDVDIKAGKNARISSIWYSPGENREYHIGIDKSELKPDYVIRDFQELRNFI